MKIYQSLRNNKTARLVSETAIGVLLQITDTGENKEVSMPTFKRWWKYVGEEVDQIVVEDDLVAAPKVDQESDSNPIKAFIEEQAKELGLTVYYGKLKSFGAVKLDGRSVFAFSHCKTNVTLWLRPSVFPSWSGPTKDHMFPIRFKISVSDDRAYLMVDHCIKRSLEYLKEHPRKKKGE